MKPFPSEMDWLDFIGVPPSLADESIPWEYNRVTWDIVRGALAIHLAVEPASGLIHLTMSSDGVELVSLNMASVEGITLAREKGKAYLVAHARTESPVHDLRLGLTPNVHVAWGTDAR